MIETDLRSKLHYQEVAPTGAHTQGQMSLTQAALTIDHSLYCG